jgi:C_GCAxxG_C_C family probable redox protein
MDGLDWVFSSSEYGWCQEAFGSASSPGGNADETCEEEEEETMETNRAAQNMAQGHVCSESVLLAACQEFEIEVDDEIIPRIAFGFAGGIGNTGAVCGAVAGAVMAIGLVKERGETMEEALRTLGVVAEFRRRFEAEMKTINCRELTGVDLTTQEGIEQLVNSDIPQTVCFPAVATAYRLVVDLLKEDS